MASSMGLGPISLPALRSAPQVDTSKFEPTTKINGVELALPAGRLGSNYFLRSWIDKKSGSIDHQLYVFDVYGGDWKFWNRANGQDANPLNFTEISHDVGSCYGGCSLYEHFGVDLPDSLLRAHPAGYDVKAYAKSGDSMVISVTADQIIAQLRVVDSLKALGRRD